ncbi:MAG: [protein-PII] uridylyltransferase [Proteobacteria bacterium]|nr:[protein-PII] uridylyltransferase [Pseudomonadota bacterium]
MGTHRAGDRHRRGRAHPRAGRRQRTGAQRLVTPAQVPDRPDDAAWAQAARERLAAGQAERAARFDAGEAVESLLVARAAYVDAAVIEAWSRTCAGMPGLRLFATGGYGRRELFPHSDVDLLVLAEQAPGADTGRALSRFFALLWDARLKTGHAVRTAEECTAAAAGDVTVVTAMMDARLLHGDPSAVDSLREAIAPSKVWPPAEYFDGKRDEQRQRHARFHDTANNLEPNIKDGPGGLRDLHTLRWMARRVLGAPDLAALVALGQLGADEFAALEREWRALARIRFGLHLVAGRAEERLLFDHQRTLATRLGYIDERRDNLAVEQLMQGFFRSAAVVLRINERLLQRFEEQLEGGVAPVALGSSETDRGFVSLHGYLAFGSSGAVDAPACLRLFAAWAAHPELRGLHSESARRLAEALPRFPAHADASPELRGLFMALMRRADAVGTLARMARLGVLARYLPAFGQVSGRMQYDLFHVFTVDQHTLAVLQHMHGFSAGANGERFSQAHAVWRGLRKPELLLLAGLFHDIAKGRGGSHSELGAEDARAFCRAHGLPEVDTDLVAWLVREHLTMSLTGQKQDISDPDVINRFALRVADRERLDHLYLLTCADIAGTSPKLWNAWKDRLFADLYTATRFALRRGLEHPVHAAERIAETRAQALVLLCEEGVEDAAIERAWRALPDDVFLRYRAPQVAWQTAAILAHAEEDADLVAVRGIGDAGLLEVFVYAADRDGLFAAAVATFDRLGLGVQQARALATGDGRVFDSFQVLPVQPGRMPTTKDVARALREALRHPDAARPSRRTLPRTLRHFAIEPRVEFADAGGFTRMTLVAGDRPGLLAAVAQVLREAGLRVHDARIATFGERVEDFFILGDNADRALDETTRQSLRAALIARLDGGHA